jgi:hypothetical protein
MARRPRVKRAPKLPKGGGSFEKTGKLSGYIGHGFSAKNSIKNKGKASFNAKHPRKPDGKFKQK